MLFNLVKNILLCLQKIKPGSLRYKNLTGPINRPTVTPFFAASGSRQ